MKRAVSISMLIGYLLIVCTFLSLKIENTMIIHAVTHQLNAVTENTVSDSALFSDDSGKHLYYVEEGIGWDNGLRVKEFEEDLYSHNLGTRTVDLSMYYDWNVIMTASRQPQAGEKIQVIENRSTERDRYLLIYPNGTPSNLADIAEADLIAISDNAAVVELENASTPFFEHEAKSILAPYQQQGWRIYSLNCVAQFADCIPTLALVLVLLLIPLVLLVLSCLMRHSQAIVLWINAGIAFILMVIAFYLISTITLPSSLLPANHIFDWNHYNLLFSEIGTALRQLKLTETLSMLKNVSNTSIWIVSVGIGIVVMFAIFELLMQVRRWYRDTGAFTYAYPNRLRERTK